MDSEMAFQSSGPVPRPRIPIPMVLAVAAMVRWNATETKWKACRISEEAGEQECQQPIKRRDAARDIRIRTVKWAAAISLAAKAVSETVASMRSFLHVGRLYGWLGSGWLS